MQVEDFQRILKTYEDKFTSVSFSQEGNKAFVTLGFKKGPDRVSVIAARFEVEFFENPINNYVIVCGKWTLGEEEARELIDYWIEKSKECLDDRKKYYQGRGNTLFALQETNPILYVEA